MANASMTTGETHGTAAVLKVVEVQRRILRNELRTLDTIAVKLGGERVEETASQAPTTPKSRSRKGTKTNSPAAPKEHQQKVYGYISETGGEVAPKAIRDALDLSENQVRKATQRLEEAGRVRRKGERQHTRYEVLTEVPAAASLAAPPAAGTLSGRVLARIQDRGFVTLAELIELTGESEDTIREICGQLIREEEVQMDRRDEKRGYVAVGGV